MYLILSEIVRNDMYLVSPDTYVINSGYDKN